MNNAFAFLKSLCMREKNDSHGVFRGNARRLSILFVVVMLFFGGCFVNSANALRTCSNEGCYHFVITSSNGNYILGRNDRVGVRLSDGSLDLSSFVFVHYLDDNLEEKTVSYGQEYATPDPSATFYSLRLVLTGDNSRSNVVFDSYEDFHIKLSSSDLSTYKIYVTDYEYRYIGEKEGSLDNSYGNVRLLLQKDENGGLLFSKDDYNTMQPVVVSDEVVPASTGKAFEIKKNEDNNSNDAAEEDNPSVPSCESSGAAGTLSWIICPTLRWLSDSAVRIYDDYVVPSLRVEPQLFQAAASSGSKSITETAWETFRNIANVFFILLLLVMIFSQLTGVGIDNYGMKRVLPKTIVVAILVNLSFVICLVCVDISNIVGNGVQSLFDGMARNFETPQTEQLVNPTTGAYGVADISASSSNLSGGGGTIMPVLILVGMFSIIAVIANPAILLTLLIGALGVLASILFLFVLLAARKAIIIMLTLVSPLAFVCYMLPNTKKLYDKWFKLWQAMLLLYPICGLLIGGGNYASRLLLSVGLAENGGFFGMFTAMAVGIIPIFFIPTVLKGSFSAMGKISARITGAGDKAASAVKRRMTNSNFNQNAQRIGAQHRAKLGAGYSAKKGKQNWYGRMKNRVAGSAAGRALGYSNVQANNVQQAQAARDETLASEAVLKDSARIYDQNKHQEKYKDMETRIKTAKAELKKNTGNALQFESSLRALVNSGTVREGDIADIIRDLINDESFDGMRNDGSFRGMLERMSRDYGKGFLASDYELGHFVRNGGVTNGGRLGEYGEYAKNVPIENDLKPSDIANLSIKSMAGLAASGKLNAEMAERVLAENPNISTEKKVMLSSLVDGRADAVTINNGGGYKEFVKDAKTIAGFDWKNNPGAEVEAKTMNKNGKIGEGAAKNLTGVTPVKVFMVNGGPNSNS